MLVELSVMEQRYHAVMEWYPGRHRSDAAAEAPAHGQSDGEETKLTILKPRGRPPAATVDEAVSRYTGPSRRRSRGRPAQETQTCSRCGW